MTTVVPHPPGRRRAAAALGVVLAGALLAGCEHGSSSGGAPGTSRIDPGGPRHGSPTATATAAPTGRARSAPAAGWGTYHHDLTRRGYSPLGPAATTPAVRWRAHLDGAVYASPLLVGDTVVAATENDSVYALRARDGGVAWRRHLGTPVPLSALPCGNIDPLGITGTPAYDRSTGAVFAVAELADPLRHELYALDVRTGQVRWHRGLDVAGMEPAPQQQRAALAVSHGRVYVALGGLFGDCGNYHGYVLASRTDGGGPLDVFRTPSEREAGIWAPPGPAVDARGHLYVTVGNGAATRPPYDGSDAVVELDPDLHQVSFFAPRTWAAENAADLDLSTTGAVLLPGGRVVVAGKNGSTYLLAADRLGGIGGQIAELGGCHGFGGIAARHRVIYVPCTEGVRAVDTSGDRLRELWRAPSAVWGTPVVGRTAVWALDPAGGRLHALDPASGRELGAVDVGTATRFAAPALGPGMIVVPTVDGIVAVGSG